MKNVIEKYVDQNELIPHGEASMIGKSVPEIIFKYGTKVNVLKQMTNVFVNLMRSRFELSKGYKELKKNPVNGKKKISEDHLLGVQQMAEEFGCNAVGFTKIDPSMIFKNAGILYPNAIVFVMEMKEEKIANAPSREAQKEIFRTYKDLGVLGNKMVDYLRKNGYAAQSCAALGTEVLFPWLAEKAGLGHCGRHGLLITPEVGPRVRIGAIFVEVDNLPYTDSDEHKWIESFCQKCKKCYNACPAEAIKSEVKLNENGTKQHIDYERCSPQFANNYGCTVCVKACTFNTQTYDKIKMGFLKANQMPARAT